MLFVSLFVGTVLGSTDPNCAAGCMSRCANKYGSWSPGNAGNTYYCNKGCVQMNGGYITGAAKYCTDPVEEVYARCYSGCQGASSSNSRRNKCRYGCEYWEGLTSPPTYAPTTEPTGEPSSVPTTLRPTSSPTHVPTTLRPTSSPTHVPTTLRPTSAPTHTPTYDPTHSPTYDPTHSPTYDPDCAAGCLDRCDSKYGSWSPGDAGNTYYCYKGCAQMNSGQMTGPFKYCTNDENLYDTCYAGCQGASSSNNRRNMCRYGCEYWETPDPNCAAGCMSRCSNKYGSWSPGNTGNTYYCNKGCAQMNSGYITNDMKFCTNDDNLYDTCYSSCQSASSSNSRRNKCRYGCEYWDQVRRMNPLERRLGAL